MSKDFFQIIKQFCTTTTIDDVLCVTGLILFGVWLLKTSLGRNALADSRPRRNNMPLYLPFIPLFIWFGATSLAVTLAPKLVGNLQGWQGAFLDNLVLSAGAIAAIAVIIFLARVSFARRLKGFGLNVKTIHKDFLAAFVNLLAVWPLVAGRDNIDDILRQAYLRPRFPTATARRARTDNGLPAIAAANTDCRPGRGNSAFARRDALSRSFSNNDTLHFGESKSQLRKSKRGVAVNPDKLCLICNGPRERRTLAGTICAGGMSGLCL